MYARKIDLATADLGRHIKNGEWVVEHKFNLRDKNSPLFENYYSYTNPDFSAINHHWGSGVVFYYIWKLFGFNGLSLFYILLSLAAFSIFFWIASRESNFTLTALLAFSLAPLMAERTEIRPEVWSVLFSAVFLFLLWKYSRGKMSWKWLLLLAPLQIVWVNFHVYFFLGLFLAGTFWFSEIARIVFQKLTDEEFAKKIKMVKVLTFMLFLVSLASLVNPFGLEGLLYPLKIFKNYGYTIVENKSVSFVENYGVMNPNFALIKAVLILTVLSFVLLLFVNRKKIFLAHLIFAVFFGVMGWVAIRNFTLLGFFALPVLAYNCHAVFGQKEGEKNFAKENGIAILYITVAAIGLWCNFKYVSAHWEKMGIGLEPGVAKSAEFFQKENIRGPIFNNYDIGGYLIFFLPEGEKVFVDNRPEAYPDAFFSQVYKPMQENADIFKKVDQEYNFNTVFFYSHDITPWGMNFLKIIQENPEWAKVFGDDYAVIYKKITRESELMNRE
ncbi:MAG: hypothetical protein PHP25_02760 [Candidatus Moranbacteria bacterium]|nr:hypothetical protein [Candidatus Moranbacteria bacterium]